MVDPRATDQGYQEYCIKELAAYLDMQIVESPIFSVTQKQLDNYQSVPDAILCDGNGHRIWAEHTSFSRCQEMRQQIGELAKRPEKYANQTLIPGIPVYKFEPLPCSYYHALNQKLHKKYQKFVELAKTTEKGILFITLLNNDPFFSSESFYDFIETVQDDHFCNGIDFSIGCFDTIIFGTHVPVGDKIEFRCAIIHNWKSIQKIMLRQENRKQLLIEINERISQYAKHQ